jgi:hypothetical protein
MTPDDLITACRARGISLEIRGDQLRCRAPVGVITPDLKQALADQKAALIQMLTAKVPTALPHEVANNHECIAVQVWSDILSESIWVVANDLPKDAWPIDASVYTHAEVKMLTHVGPDTLEWVHAAKQVFGAQVIAGGRRLRSHPEAPGVSHGLDQLNLQAL